MNKQASILDPIQASLSPEVYDVNGKLKPEVRQKMLDGLYRLIPKDKVIEAFLVGSMTGYQYSDTSDLDVNGVAAPELLTEEFNAHRKATNGRDKIGLHPINYLFAPFRGELNSWKDSLYGIYDLIGDKWVVPPDKTLNHDPKNYFKFELMTAALVQSRFIKMVTKYKMLDILEKQKSIALAATNDKIERHELGVTIQRLKTTKLDLYKQINDMAEALDEERKLVYNDGFGVPRQSYYNIVFKLIEHGLHGELFAKIKEKDEGIIGI